MSDISNLKRKRTNKHITSRFKFLCIGVLFFIIGCKKDEVLDYKESTNLEESAGESNTGFELKVNCGGNKVIYGTTTFEADKFFTGNGKIYSNFGIEDILATDQDEIFKTERSSQTTFGYSIPVENGTYEVTLHFAEIYHGTSADRNGSSVFSVDIEQQTVLSNYNIIEEVESLTAVSKVFEVAVTDGVLNMNFYASVNQAKLSAFEIKYKTSPSEEPENIDDQNETVIPGLNRIIGINCGGNQEMFQGVSFNADNYFTSGKGYTNNEITAIDHTNLDPIYKSERSNDFFAYAVPVTDGTYTLRLHFAEIYFGATGGGADGEGNRVFNITIEGNQVLADFDINKEVGPMAASVKTFTVEVLDGVLNFEFNAKVNQAKLSAFQLFGKGDLIKGPCDWRTDRSSANHNHIEGQTAIVNNKLYLFGGFDPGIIGDNSSPLFFTNETEIYDPLTDSWTNGAPMPVALSHAGMQAVENDIWIIGGFLGDNGGLGTDMVQIYNTLTNTWRKGPSIPNKRAAVAAVLVDNRIHIFGGYSEDREGNIDEHFFYDLNNPSLGWQERAKLPTARGHHGGAVVDGIIYAIGGQLGHNSTNRGNIKAVEAYDFATNLWTTVQDLPDADGRSHFELGTLTFDGKILIAGGNNGARDIIEYNPKLNQWTKKCNLPNAMLTPSMMIFNNELIITCGGIGNNWNPSKATIWIPAKS